MTKLKNGDFVSVFKENNQQSESKNVELCFDLLTTKNIIVEPEIQDHLTSLLKALRKTFRQYWKNCDRSYERFTKKHEQWLIQDFDFGFKKKRDRRKSTFDRIGRPSVPFYSKSMRGKRQAVASISSKYNYDTHLLISASLYSGKRNNNKKLAAAIKILMKTYEPQRKNISPKMSSDEGLALMIDTEMSRHQYQLIKNRLKVFQCNVLPSYVEILKAKEKCRPTGISVSDTKASVPIDKLLDHTARKIVKLCEDKLIKFMDDNQINSLSVEMINKYGFDGSSGQSQYNQEIDSDSSDANLFAVTLSPLVLKCEKLHFWENPSPSSVRHCRPISLEFVKESKELNVNTKKIIETQISEMENIAIVLSNKKIITVNQTCLLTAIDGKVFSHITNTSSMQCCVCCKSTPSQMNNLSNNFIPDPSTLIYGISPLHSWIRFLEAILHISYRLRLKKWRISGEKDKAALKQRKIMIQKNSRRNST